MYRCGRNLGHRAHLRRLLPGYNILIIIIKMKITIIALY